MWTRKAEKPLLGPFGTKAGMPINRREFGMRIEVAMKVYYGNFIQWQVQSVHRSHTEEKRSNRERSNEKVTHPLWNPSMLNYRSHIKLVVRLKVHIRSPPNLPRPLR